MGRQVVLGFTRALLSHSEEKSYGVEIGVCSASWPFRPPELRYNIFGGAVVTEAVVVS